MVTYYKISKLTKDNQCENKVSQHCSVGGPRLVVLLMDKGFYYFPANNWGITNTICIHIHHDWEFLHEYFAFRLYYEQWASDNADLWVMVNICLLIIFQVILKGSNCEKLDSTMQLWCVIVINSKTIEIKNSLWLSLLRISVSGLRKYENENKRDGCGRI